MTSSGLAGLNPEIMQSIVKVTGASHTNTVSQLYLVEGVLAPGGGCDVLGDDDVMYGAEAVVAVPSHHGEIESRLVLQRDPLPSRACQRRAVACIRIL